VSVVVRNFLAVVAGHTLAAVVGNFLAVVAGHTLAAVVGSPVVGNSRVEGGEAVPVAKQTLLKVG